MFFNGSGKQCNKLYDICLNLTKDKTNQNYHVYIDDWYTSVRLLNEFKNLGIDCTGTIKKSIINT